MMKMDKKPVSLAWDRIHDIWPKELKNARVGAVLHPASVLSNYVHVFELLKSLNGKLFQLKALFGPQHGILGQTQDNMIEWEGYLDPELNIPVYSLYGKHREPTAEMLEGLDALIIDLQDVGARYYTFIWTLYLCMKACEKQKVPIFVVNRPNPLGNQQEGPVLNPNYRSFVGLHPIIPRHGKTIGELALQFKKEAFPNCELHIFKMKHWNPVQWFDETGLPWVLPSPNMPTLDTAIVYPGMCLLEATNISEARGTTKPFELLGAPWIEGKTFARDLNQMDLPGAYFREAYFQPTFHKHQGELCQGVQIHVTDRKEYLPWRTGLEVIQYIRKKYPEHFQWKQPPYEYEYDKLPIEVLVGGNVHKYFPD